MDSNSSHAFFKKLSDKERQKAFQLYEEKDKENVHCQIVPSFKPRRQKRTKTECSILLHDNKKGNHWYLDNTDVSSQGQSQNVKIINNYLCLSKGVVEFSRILEANQFQKELALILEKHDFAKQQTENRSITINIWTPLEDVPLVDFLIGYSLPFLAYGKGTWSLAALTSNKRFDLLSLDDHQGSTLWKSKNPLLKVQLQRERLMKRVFGFSSQKQRSLGEHEILAKLQLPNSNKVYFIIRRVNQLNTNSNAQLLIEQEIILENISNLYTFSIIRSSPGFLEDDQRLRKVLDSFNIKVKSEEEMEKHERQNFLKCLIMQLQGELVGKQEELKHYKSRKESIEQQLGIPSERIPMGEEHYLHLKRRIKESKII